MQYSKIIRWMESSRNEYSDAFNLAADYHEHFYQENYNMEMCTIPQDLVELARQVLMSA